MTDVGSDEMDGAALHVPRTGGCSAAERGDASPVLGPGFARPFRWEIVVTDVAVGGPAHVRELARIPIVPRDAKPPIW